MLGSFKIFETEQVLKNIEKDFRGRQHKIKQKLATYIYPQLRQQPYFGKSIKKLSNFTPETWRYRIGDLRLFYTIDEEKKIVSILTIDFRGSIY